MRGAVAILLGLGMLLASTPDALANSATACEFSPVPDRAPDAIVDAQGPFAGAAIDYRPSAPATRMNLRVTLAGGGPVDVDSLDFVVLFAQAGHGEGSVLARSGVGIDSGVRCEVFFLPIGWGMTEAFVWANATLSSSVTLEFWAT